MTLVYLDGCEDLSSFGGTGTATIVSGRNGNALQCSGSGPNLVRQVLSTEESDTFTVGFALRITALTGATAVVTFQGDAGVTSHVNLQVAADGSIIARRSTISLGTTVTGLIALNTWYYIEFQSKLSDTVGTIVVRVNGVAVLSLTAQDTKNAGTKTVFDSVQFSSTTSTTAQFDDVYLDNSATFQGDIVIETLYPNGNGNANQWLGSDGDSTNNYLLVNETGAPVTTSYTADSVSGHQDMYTLSDLVHTTGTVVGVCHTAYAAKTDAVNTRQIKLVNRRAADNKSGALDLATTYAGYVYVLTQDPETSAAWTIANVNALQSGVEVV